MVPEQNDASLSPRARALQWVALLGPPIIWLVQFEARYAIAGKSEGRFAMSATACVALVLVLACAGIALRQWRLAHRSPLDRWAHLGERIRFMGALGLLSAGLFFLVIVAQFLAEVFISPGKS